MPQQFNRFGSELAQRVPTPTEIRGVLNEKVEALRERLEESGETRREPLLPKDADVRGDGHAKPAGARNSQALLDDPANQDNGLYQQVLALAVKLPRIDRQLGVEDQTDQHLSAALAVKCKEAGMTCVSHVVMGLDGRRAFAVDTPDLTAEWRRRADVDVMDAVRQTLDASTERMAQVNRELSQQAELDRRQQRERGPEDPNRGGPVMA